MSHRPLSNTSSLKITAAYYVHCPGDRRHYPALKEEGEESIMWTNKLVWFKKTGTLDLMLEHI
jgi:hypothetical protein